jgi:hypothetical protein
LQRSQVSAGPQPKVWIEQSGCLHKNRRDPAFKAQNLLIASEWWLSVFVADTEKSRCRS